MKNKIVALLFLAALICAGWVLMNKFEGNHPVVDIQLPSPFLNKTYEMSLNIQDNQTGLKKVVVMIMQAGKEKVLLEKSYDSAGFVSALSVPLHVADTFRIPIESWKYGMTDGEAVIRVMVSDYSWKGWGKGNVFYTEKNVIIDTIPPKVNILTKRHNVERGGSGLAIYRLFEDDVKSGVMVGDNFFPGHSGMFKDPGIYAAFFALSHLQGPDTQLSVVAEDVAGNKTKRGFYHYIREKKFRTDTLNISDRFLQAKMPDFELDPGVASGNGNGNPLLEKFLKINSEIRKQNVDRILSVPTATEPVLHWKNRFLRLKGSARRAGYADHRVYKYKGRKIGKATHLGVDLASVSNASIKAANTGRVIFADFEGIFGNTVVIDHGFGLCSLYAHLSQINVNVNDLVQRGQEIGSTGMTGLAGGDHLHFSMIVHNVFVNPIEWWDATWIKNNITSKIDKIRQNANG